MDTQARERMGRRRAVLMDALLLTGFAVLMLVWWLAA